MMGNKMLCQREQKAALRVLHLSGMKKRRAADLEEAFCGRSGF